MVAEQHKKIKGYRDLTQAEIDLMNRIKEFGPQLEQLIFAIGEHITNQFVAVADDDETSEEGRRLAAADPFRWLDTGQQQLQQGLMAITRAVAQPTFF